MLRNEGDKVSLVVELPTSTVYRRVVEGARGCYTRIFDITADYFPDTRSGSISASMKTAYTMGTAFVIDITPNGSESKIDVVSHRSATAMPRNVEKWLSGDYTACSFN